MSRLLLLVFVAFQAFYIVSSCPRRRPSPRPCSWRTCRHEWSNPYQPYVSQGQCISQSRSSKHIYYTHHSTQPCPGSQSCDWRTQSRTRCSCRHVYNCYLRGWTSWSGHVSNGGCARQSRYRTWNENVKFTDRDSNCNGIPSSCGNTEHDYRTYCQCRHAYNCYLRPWTAWSGHVGYDSCARQTRYRVWNERITYTGRSGNCHGIPTTCGRTEHDQRKYCSCQYATCTTLPWTTWSETTAQQGHCRTESRHQRQRKTIVYKSQINTCNGVGPQSCPQDVTSTREKVVYCSPLPNPTIGRWNNPQCSQTNQRCKSHCTLECSSLTGYQRIGSPTRVCENTGQWSSLGSDAYCKDIEPPSITCPKETTFGNDPGKDLKRVTLPVLEASDNSGKKPEITSSHGLNEHEFKISKKVYEVVFTARDEAGLTDKCTWYVHVKDTEKPKVLTCPDDIKIITGNSPTRVNWALPTFQDNYDQFPVIAGDKVPGSQFPYGTTPISYSAADSYGNVVMCKFEITVSPHNCPGFNAPKHGSRACNTKVDDQFNYHMYCTASCEQGYAFMPGKPVFDVYQCAGGYWQGVNTRYPGMKQYSPDEKPWQDCIEKDTADGITKIVNAYVGKCNENNAEALETIKQNFLSSLNQYILANVMFCRRHESNCKIENVQVYCGRSKRSGDTSMQVISAEIVMRDDASKVNKKEALRKHEMMKMDLDATEIAADKKIVDAMGIKGMHLEGYKTKIACKVGEIVQVDQGETDEFDRSSCVKCAEGTYYDTEEHECIPCPEGTYQDIEGETSCKKCPQGTWTIASQASNHTECLDICGPGEYSQRGNGLATCLACTIGTFQPDFRQSTCVKCPSGKTTKILGSASNDDCH